MVSEFGDLTIAELLYSGLEPPNPVVTESKITGLFTRSLIATSQEPRV